MGEVDIDRGIL